MATVIFHGVVVAADYPARVTAAQAMTTYTLNGRQVGRVPYGREGSALPLTAPCPDCAVLTGQLHVPGCELESCPVCGRRLMSCGCLDTLESPSSVVETGDDGED